METRYCKKCGNEFIPQKGLKDYCSLKCRNSRDLKIKRSKTIKCDKCNIDIVVDKRERNIQYCDACKKIFVEDKIKNAKTNLLNEIDNTHSIAVGQSTKGKYKGNNINSILELSSRTVVKILQRLKLGCLICGWNESNCDIHHINGKKVKNCDGHWNLTYICPNCHRLVHTHKIDKSSLISLDKILPNNWKDFYYG